MASGLVKLTDDISICGKISEVSAMDQLLEAPTKSWLYLTTDEGEDIGVVPNGYESLKAAATGHHVVTRHIPVQHKSLTLALAGEALTAMKDMPRPMVISCRSNARAGAVFLLHHAACHSLTADQALEYAASNNLSFLRNASLADWLVAAVAKLVHRRPAPLFRQLFESESSTYTYILADPKTKDAIIIDPVDLTVDRDVQMMEEMGLHTTMALNTHAHADHVTGTGLMKQRVAGLQSAISEASRAKADVKLKDGDRITFGDYYVEVRATPGHTNGCVTFVMDDRSMAFTGDALLIRGCGRTDFQEGDARKLYQSVHERIFTLPGETVVYPAHDYKGRTSTSMAEEKAYNPRLTKPVDEYVSIMDSLGLPYPRKIDQALPLNMVCGFTA